MNSTNEITTTSGGDPAKTWSLLRNVGDWDRYRAMMSEAFQVDVNNVSWGRGPAAFPCLAASYPVSKMKIVGCYVYVSDAMSLISSGGGVPVAKAVAADNEAFVRVQVPPPQTAQSFQTPEDVRRAIQGALSLVGSVHECVQKDLAGRSEHDKSVIAHLLTIVKCMVDTGICKQDQYQEWYSARLAQVDQVQSEQRRAMLSPPTMLDETA